jgi:aminoglycoside 3-N-acetyltransferase
MREITPTQVNEAIKTIGIQPGDGLLVHSAVQFLGQPVGGIGMYLDAILDIIGHKGTIAVPTFNFSFAKGKSFNPKETPSQKMGVFSEFVRLHPETKRTPHPLQSIAVFGHYADDLATRDTLSAFNPGSPFERMLELNFKALLLGADIQAISMLHYSEQRIGVPYRYWKDFSGKVFTNSGIEERTYRMYVRDMDLDPKLSLKPVQALLESRNQWISAPLNYGQIASCLLVDFVSAVDFFLETDPWSLVTNLDQATTQKGGSN